MERTDIAANNQGDDKKTSLLDHATDESSQIDSKEDLHKNLGTPSSDSLQPPPSGKSFL